MPEWNRTVMLRRACRLLVAIDASRAGLTVDQVAEILEGSRRTAYRWIQVLTGDAELPYDYIDATRTRGGRLFRMRPIPVSHAGISLPVSAARADDPKAEGVLKFDAAVVQGRVEVREVVQLDLEPSVDRMGMRKP